MMIKNRNKLSILTAFIVGTTMLSSVDKAWGMDDGNDLPGGPSSSHVTVAPRFFLAGTAHVTEETRKAAVNLLTAFEKNTNLSTNKKGIENVRKALIERSFGVPKDKDTVMLTFFESLARVVDDLHSEKPSLASNSLVTESLKIITLAVEEDPYDSITRDESKPAVPVDEMDSIRQSLLKAKQDAKLSDFFSAELPNLVASYSTIVPSLIARYPREEEKIERLQRNLRTYFGLNNPVEPKKPNARQIKRQEELKLQRENEFKQKLNTLAEAFYLLKQINDRPIPSSTPIQPEPLTASSSSNSAVTSATPPLELDIREFHMGKHNDCPSSGFSAFEGTHRWTDGKKATIVFPLENMEPRPSRISFLNTGGFVTPSHIQKLIVRVNENETGSYDYTVTNNNHTIDIPLLKDDPLPIIEFEIPYAKSPLELGISPEKRALGISFGEVQFSFE